MPTQQADRDGRRRELGVSLFTGLVGGAAGGLIGAVTGANCGGNYATGFQFAGLRGYEATGFIGEIVGFIVMSFLSFVVARRLTRRWSRPA